MLIKQAGQAARVLLLSVLVMMLVTRAESAELTHQPVTGGTVAGNAAAGYPEFAVNQVRLGIAAYYRRFERLPSSWSEVNRSGVWQTPIVGTRGKLIDPDDSTLSHWGDMYFLAASVPPTLLVQGMLWEEPNVTSIPIEPPKTYTEHFAQMDSSTKDLKNIAGVPEPGSLYMNDSARLTQFAILHSVSMTLRLYKELHGNFPLTWASYMTSGIGPINSSSINPVTGTPFYGDGRAGDVHYEFHPARDDRNESYTLVHVLDDGSLPVVRFTY